jgi:ribosomal protein L7/L12
VLKQFKVVQKLSVRDAKRLTKNELLTIVNDALNRTTDEKIKEQLL